MAPPTCPPRRSFVASDARRRGQVSEASHTEIQTAPLEWFRSRAAAKVVIENWRRHYNAVRPHSSLDSLTPLEFKRQLQPIPNRAIPQE